MFKVFKKGGKDKEGKEGFELRFRFHATRVPPNGYKQLQVSIVTPEKNKETAKTSAVIVRNGACQWPDTITESVHLIRDKRTNQLESKVFKFVVSTGQSRGGVLGETSLNIADCHLSSQVEQKALPLKNCSAGTVLNVTLQMIPLSGPREEDENRSEASELEAQEVQEFTDDELSDDDSTVPPQVRSSMESNRSFQLATQKNVPSFDPPTGAQPSVPAPWVQPNGLRVTPAASYEMDDEQEYDAAGDDLRFEVEALRSSSRKLGLQVETLSEQLAAAVEERDRLKREAEEAKLQVPQDGDKARLVELEDSLACQRAEMQALRVKMTDMQESSQVLLDELRESETHEQQQQAEIEDLIRKARDAEDELKAFERKREIETRRAREEGENWRAIHAEQQSLIEELKLKMKHTEEEIGNAANAHESDTAQKLVSALAENARLSQDLSVLRDSARSAASQVRHIEDLEKEATELAQENFQIAQDLSQVQAALSSKETELDTLREEIAELRGAKVTRNPELAEAYARIKVLETEAKTLTAHIAMPEGGAGDMRIRELEAEVQKLTEQVSKSGELKVDGITKALDSQDDAFGLATKLAEAEEEVRLTKSRAQELELELAAVSEQLAMAQRAHTFSADSSARIAELEAEVARLLAHREESQQPGEAEAQLKKAVETAEALGEEVVRLHQKLTDETSRADVAEAKLTSESASAQQVREDSKKRVTEVESALEKAQGETAKLEAELARVLRDVGGEDGADVAARAVAEKGALEARVMELEAEVAELEAGESGRRLKELNDEVAKLSGEREQLTRQVEVRDEELGRLRQEKVATAARMMVAGMRKGTMFAPPKGSDESSELQAQVHKLEEQLKQKEEELAAAQRKMKTAEIIAATAAKAETPKGDGAANQEDVVGPLYRKIRALETSLVEAKEENKQTEKVLREQISKLEFANEQLAAGGSGDGDGSEQLHHELMRLQHQNASMRSRERELTTMLSKQEVLEFEVERLQELNDELQQRLAIQRDVMEGVKTVERLEMELHEALELNRLYKGQLKNAFSSSQNVQSAAIHNLGTPDQVIEDLQTHKRLNQQLETDLKELRQRYAELSLKFVENEQSREDLVMKVKQMKLGGAANGGNTSTRLLDSLPSFSGLLGSQKAA